MSVERKYYSRGKLLLSGEYFVCDGALSLALPTTIGQRMEVESRPSYSPHLHFMSFDREGKMWFEGKFEFWHFKILETTSEETALVVQKIFQQVRKQNSHFLREDEYVVVKNILEFPLDWGLGSSSTLINNIAQWALVSPFELLFKTFGGSGYDVACAQSQGPITYHKKDYVPQWEPTYFNPPFKDSLYFVYLGNKQNSREGIKSFKEIVSGTPQEEYLELVEKITKISKSLITVETLTEFERLILLHEDIVSKFMGIQKVKDRLFSDYFGVVKSLGAWGGDFVLVSSSKGPKETQRYFYEKGYDTFIPFVELIKMREVKSSDKRTQDFL